MVPTNSDDVVKIVILNYDCKGNSKTRIFIGRAETLTRAYRVEA